jgi:membrane protein DedA with SNARE-associated domain
MVDFFSAETYQAFEAWIISNPTWAGVAIFAICVGESLAVVGLFIPGLIAMGIIGGLVTTGVLQLAPTLLWAISGAIVGDGISYWIGRHFKHHLPHYWPFRRFPRWLARGKEFFIKHGGKSIIVGRFVGPVRPFIPVVAGMMAMTPQQFFVANVVSAIIWAPLYMLPGNIISLVFFK